MADGGAERTYRITGARLRQRIWDPLADLVRGASYVFIVPDGALNLVSFAALPVEGNKYLVESGPVIHLLSTERDLVPTEATPTGRGLLAVGGPAYDLQLPALNRAAVLRSNCGRPGPLRFEDLPGSRAEVRDIARIWSPTSIGSAANAAPIDDVTVLSGRAASKSAVARASAGRRVVHLATHGFFLGSQCARGPANTRAVGGIATASSLASVAADNPLLLSGLAFAGANRQATTRAGQDDGILTAEEIAALNLQGTEWAVLSACDTGLGEIRTGEGVFGLRRAFQIAGVRTIIMSLWSVEDQSTRSWMQALYEGRFQQHLSTADAVHRAAVRVLQSRRMQGQSTHPFYWAAFVAAGDWK
jgi:CHAT domain-containing protein